MKKIIVLLLCCIMILSLVFTLYSCNSGDTGGKTGSGGENNSAGDNIADDTPEDAENPDDRNSITDNLPDMNFEKYDFRIFNSSDFSDRLYAGAENGDVINDAFYKANKTVEDRFNINISIIESVYDSSEKAMKAAIKSGDDAFDLAFGHDYGTGAASLEGLFVDIHTLNYLDYSKPWWPNNTVDSLTIKGKMFVFSNSITTLGLDWTRLLYINKGTAKDMGVEVPYKDVFDGTWTLDKLINITRDIYTDLNGDGKRDRDDKYGYAFTGPFYCSIEPFGVQVVHKTADGFEINVMNERTQKIVDMMYELIVNSPGTFYYRNEEQLSEKLFLNGNAFILHKYLQDARLTFRASDIDYGILPFPKLDENQESYYAGYHDRLFAVPVTAQDLDRAAIIIEAMSAEGWKKVFPAYYEISMKNKFLADEESIKILDLIYSVRVLDFAYIYSIKYYMMLDDLLSGSKPSADLSSYYEKSVGAVQKALDKIEEEFDNIG